jgi:hypothetical protein
MKINLEKDQIIKAINWRKIIFIKNNIKQILIIIYNKYKKIKKVKKVKN